MGSWPSLENETRGLLSKTTQEISPAAQCHQGVPTGSKQAGDSSEVSIVNMLGQASRNALMHLQSSSWVGYVKSILNLILMPVTAAISPSTPSVVEEGTAIDFPPENRRGTTLCHCSYWQRCSKFRSMIHCQLGSHVTSVETLGMANFKAIITFLLSC